MTETRTPKYTDEERWAIVEEAYEIEEAAERQCDALAKANKDWSLRGRNKLSTAMKNIRGAARGEADRMRAEARS